MCKIGVAGVVLVPLTRALPNQPGLPLGISKLVLRCRLLLLISLASQAGNTYILVADYFTHSVKAYVVPN